MSVAYGQTFKVELGSTEIKGNLATTVTEGTGIRTNNPERQLVGTSFGSNGKPKGGTGSDTTDDGDLNFRKGDVFSSPSKIFSRLNLTDGRYSMVLSVRAWADATLLNHDVPQGNIPGGVVYNQTLSDNRFTNLNKFANVVPWEAYGTVKFGDSSWIRVGRQAIDWSTARFFLDSSHINPIDTTALDAPGALLDREVSIPTGFLDAKYKMRSGVEVEAFYQLEQRLFNLAGCGTFFNQVNLGMDPGCKGMVANAFTGVNALYLPSADSVWDNSSYSVAHGDYTPGGNKYHNEHEQGGLAIRYHVNSLNLDTSLYILNLESRVPVISGRTSTNPDGVAASGNTPDPGLVQAGAPLYYAALASELKTIGYIWDYPGNIHTFGFNASTKLHGWHATTEVEYIPNQAVGQNAPDLVMALLAMNSPLLHRSIGLPPGAYDRGYDRLHNLKVDMNLVRVIRITNLPSLSQTRYGRGFQWGFSTQGFGGMAACGAAVSPLSGNITGCVNKGYITANAFGYRTRLALNYDAGHGLILSPAVTWAHDVRGNSSDTQILQGRGVISPSLEWQWRKKYFGGVSYTAEATGSTYNTLEDRNYVKIWGGFNF
jgi:hypothetical protein